jgi:hypothetical protein
MYRSGIVALSVAGVSLLGACGGGGGPVTPAPAAPQISSLTISPQSVFVAAGTTEQLSATATLTDGSTTPETTPREHSSGSKRRLGSISKRGDGYLRMLLVFGARALLWSANSAKRARRPLDALRAWALRVEARTCHNKAAIALANKLARIIWATWHRGQDFQLRAELPATA